jgi:hypothetical protein
MCVRPIMSSTDSPIFASQLERDILRSLCSGNIDAAGWKREFARLATHEWRDPEHKVVYDALGSIRSADSKTRRDELPAQVTRMGFPDVDFGKYFDGDNLPNVPLDRLIDRLETTEDS